MGLRVVIRTTSEIARWSQMNDDERLRLMEHVLPGRERARAPWSRPGCAKASCCGAHCIRSERCLARRAGTMKN